MSIFYLEMQSPLGPLVLVQQGDVLTHCQLAEGFVLPAGAHPEATPLLGEAARQLEEYFAGQRRVFALPLFPAGTEFQRLVWAEMACIPYGETRSYGQLAAAIGRPKAARAVGGACNKNPLMIFLPCHRVVGSGGALVGFAPGLHYKEALLRLEGSLPV